jgi:hypothetical protein
MPGWDRQIVLQETKLYQYASAFALDTRLGM